MGYRTTIQIVLIIVAIVIISTYIKPTFESMQQIQEETKEYKVALENAESFNAELGRLLSTANSFSTTELRALDRYLPDSVDTVAVMRDIETIVEDNDMLLSSLNSDVSGERGAAHNVTSAQGQGQLGDDDTALYVQTFDLNVIGTYEQFKNVLHDLERNAYPLEASSILFAPTDEQLYTFSLTLESYSLTNTQE